MKANSRTVLMQGNEACAEGAIAAGVKFFAAYPITPSNEIANIMSRRLPQGGGKFVQMEDEIASLAAAMGASLAGVRAMDATSGPGFSLKTEGLGVACMAEIPLVLVNVQRVGPAIGMATSPAQGDIMQARYGSHGDYSLIVLCPTSVQEMFDLTIRAVDLSERFRVPVILLTDQVIGHMRERTVIPPSGSIVTSYRREPRSTSSEFHPYRGDEKGVPPMARFGSEYRWYANTSTHDEDGFQATGDHAVSRSLIERLTGKIEDNKDELVEVKTEFLDDAEVVVLAFGCTARPARGAVMKARDEGIKAGLLVPLTLWPVADAVIAQIADTAKTIVVPEMNLGQYVHPVREIASGRKAEVISLPKVGGEPFVSDDILNGIKETLCHA